MTLRLINGRVVLPGAKHSDGLSGIEINGDQIVSVGGVDGPAEHVIDLGGRYLVPGLTNCHTHVVADEKETERPRAVETGGEVRIALRAARRAARALRSGITGIRDCNGPPTVTLPLRDAIAAGEICGPRIFASGSAICATGGHMHFWSCEADGPDAVAKGVRQQIKQGADFIKLVVEAPSNPGSFQTSALQLTRAELTAGVDAAHQRGKRVTAHAVSRFGIEAALAAGVDCIEHGYDLLEEHIVAMADVGTWLVPTISVHASISRRGIEAGLDPSRVSFSKRILSMSLESVNRAYQAGVRIACGSDAGSPLNPITGLHEELSLLVQAGLTPGEALLAATESAASLMDMSESVGSIAPGQRADLIATNGDPLADIAAVRDVVLVISGGDVIVDRINSGPGECRDTVQN